MPWAGSARCLRPCLGPEADRRRGAPDPRHGPARLSPRLRRLLRRRRPGRPPGAASRTAVPPPHRRVSLCGRCASPCGRWVRASVSRHAAATPPPHRRDAALPRHRRIRRPGGGASSAARRATVGASRRPLVATVRRWPWRPWGRFRVRRGASSALHGRPSRSGLPPSDASAASRARGRSSHRDAAIGSPACAPRLAPRPVAATLTGPGCHGPTGSEPPRDSALCAATGAIEPPPPRRTPSAFSVGDLPQDPALAPPSRPRRFPSAASRRLGRLSPVPPGPLLRRMG